MVAASLLVTVIVMVGLVMMVVSSSCLRRLQGPTPPRRNDVAAPRVANVVVHKAVGAQWHLWPSAAPLSTTHLATTKYSKPALAATDAPRAGHRKGSKCARRAIVEPLYRANATVTAV